MTTGPIIQHTTLQGVRSSFIQIQIVDVVFLFDRSSVSLRKVELNTLTVTSYMFGSYFYGV